MPFIAFWRLVRLVAGITLVILVGVPAWRMMFTSQFRYPAFLTGLYLIFNEFVAFVLQPSERWLDLLRARYWRSPKGHQNSLRAVQVMDVPKIRVQNRTTLMQILIAVAGIMVGFSSRSGAAPSPLSLAFLVFSVLLGVLYMLVLNGGIREDKAQGGLQVIVMSSVHELWLEVFLNLQVTALMLGSSAFFP